MSPTSYRDLLHPAAVRTNLAENSHNQFGGQGLERSQSAAIAATSSASTGKSVVSPVEHNQRHRARNGLDSRIELYRRAERASRDPETNRHGTVISRKMVGP